MLQQNTRWEEKIRFFSKFLGFEELELEQTLDQTNKTQITRRPSKGIKLVHESYLNYSTIAKQTDTYRNQRKWVELLLHPFQRSCQDQVLKLMGRSTYAPKKVLPWLTKDRHKITANLLNLKRAQLRAILSPYLLYKLQSQPQNIVILSNKINHPKILEIACLLALMREDLVISDLYINITHTVTHYLCDSSVQALSVLSYICCSGAYLPFIMDIKNQGLAIINKISYNIKKNCISAIFLTRDRVPIQKYVHQWIHTFWTCISDIGSPLHQKIIYYIMAHQVSLQALSKICEATVEGLARILNQGSIEKSAFTLSNPKVFLDEEVFLRYLFVME